MFIDFTTLLFFTSFDKCHSTKPHIRGIYQALGYGEYRLKSEFNERVSSACVYYIKMVYSVKLLTLYALKRIQKTPEYSTPSQKNQVQCKHGFDTFIESIVTVFYTLNNIDICYIEWACSWMSFSQYPWKRNDKKNNKLNHVIECTHTMKSNYILTDQASETNGREWAFIFNLYQI